ncbi:hypothetical protein J3F83DRAFT_358195 [Trichoderma novae-zelandiae]
MACIPIDMSPVWPIDSERRTLRRTQQDADPVSTPMPLPNVSLWGRNWMEKLELGHFRISPANHRVAEFHRLIKNGHFWGKATPFFSRSLSPS